MKRRLVSVTAFALVLGAVCLPIAAPVAAQSGASFLIEIEGGRHEGTYELTSPEPCMVLIDDSWYAFAQDPAGQLFQVSLTAGGFAPALILDGFRVGGAIYVQDFESSVEESGADAIVTVVAQDPDSLDTPVTIRLTLECQGFVDQRASAPTPVVTLDPGPTPAIQGPPPDGSTAVHLSIGFGPWAGEYDAWTLDDACFISDGQWLVTVHDTLTIPSAVTLIAAEATADDPALGLLGATFGSAMEPVRYQTAPGVSFELAPEGRASVSDPAATAYLPDGTRSQGLLEATADCAAIVP